MAGQTSLAGIVGIVLIGMFSDRSAAGMPPASCQSRSETDRAIEPAASFSVGFAVRDITPSKPVPMWGYGARHDQLSRGVLDRLRAEALVIRAGLSRLAIVALDLGRSPTPAMMEQIREMIARRGISHVLICGSHTHHGPVIELTDQDGFGRGKFDDAVAYAREVPVRIAEAILAADDNLRPARIGLASRDLGLNRNRHTKRPTKPTDPRLSLIRFDQEVGTPLAILVHYSAHPVLTPSDVLSFSADYPG